MALLKFQKEVLQYKAGKAVSSASKELRYLILIFFHFFFRLRQIYFRDYSIVFIYFLKNCRFSARGIFRCIGKGVQTTKIFLELQVPKDNVETNKQKRGDEKKEGGEHKYFDYKVWNNTEFALSTLKELFLGR